MPMFTHRLYWQAPQQEQQGPGGPRHVDTSGGIDSTAIWLAGLGPHLL